jgi:glycosyltransferase involved in cell wall biosynthesis
MIHIVHFSSAPGGIEILLKDIIRSFPAGTFRVFVIRPPEPGNENVYAGSSLDITYGHKANLKAILCLFKYAVKYNKDIFHVLNIGPYFLMAMRLAGVKNLVYSIRGTIYWSSPLQGIIRRLIWRMAVSDRYRIIANSGHSRKMFIRAAGKTRQMVDLIYNPVASEKFKPEKKYKNPGSGLEIIYSGRLAEGKNLFTWLEVAASVKRAWPESKFFLYGDGPLKTKLKNYANELGISDSVQFMGFTSDMVTAYRKADLFIFLSNHESFGNVVVESILCGTPAIASDIPAMREIFINYPQVLVSLDENLISNIIEKMDQIDQINELIPNMIVEFRSRFSAEDHIVKLKNVYNSFDV